MSQWYEHRKDHGNHLWLYSERGWMSFLFWHVLAERLDFVLDDARNQAGQRLRDVIGAFDSHTTLTEYELGPKGFGTPDGSFMTASPTRRFFVFVEAKQHSFSDAYLPPDPKTVEALSAPGLDMKGLCEGNKFNSSSNGQLELRWRFVNALRDSTRLNERVVSEQHVRNLPPDLTAGDRFYWRLALGADRNNAAHWRRVDMRSDLRRLHEHMEKASDFFLLSITADDNLPDFRRFVRLYDGEGGRVDAGERVFWLDRRSVERTLAKI